MKQAKSGNEPTLDDSAAVALAKQAAASISELWEGLGKPKSVNRFQEVTFIKLIDELDNIKHEFISKTDGRPQSLDFSSDLGPTEKYENYGPDNEMLDEIEEDRWKLKMWAECTGPGYETVAYIAGREFDGKELAILRDWIDQVLDWHKANPDRQKQ